MIFYLLTIFLLFVFSIIEANFTLAVNTKRWMSAFAFIVLIIQVGLRWETGTDWNAYLTHFESIKNFSITTPFYNQFEFGYNVFVWLINSIFSNYSFFLVLHAIIYYYLIFKSFKHYTPYLFLSLLMFYSITMGMMGSNRQLIAVAICLYALRFVIDKEPVKFFVLIFVAITFHTTAFLFFVYYFIRREIKPITLIIILSCSFFLGKTQLPLILFSNIGSLIGGESATKALLYLDNAKNTLKENEFLIIGLLKKIIFLAIFYYNRIKLSNHLRYYTIMLNGYIIGIAFYLLFADSLLVMISRGSLFFNIMEPLLIASQLCLFKLKANKVSLVIVFLIFSFILFFQSIASYPDLFLPYKGIFINSDYLRIMY